MGQRESGVGENLPLALPTRRVGVVDLVENGVAGPVGRPPKDDEAHSEVWSATETRRAD